MFFFHYLKTFFGIGWWYGRSDYPRNDTFIMIPVYQNQIPGSVQKVALAEPVKIPSAPEESPITAEVEYVD
jgi:hypothetical protein